MTHLRKPLTSASLPIVLERLIGQDPLLRDLFLSFGTPPLWQRTQSFSTLVQVVLEQKVSLASAAAVMRRLRLHCPEMQPADFLRVPTELLRKAGFSERKASYCQSIAKALLSDQLNLSQLRRCSDEQVMQQLVAIRGIGPWTAGVYLLMAMRRPDAWASGDRALVVSLAESEQLEIVPSYAQLDERAQMWRPYRGVASRLLWHAYLSRRR